MSRYERASGNPYQRASGDETPSPKRDEKSNTEISLTWGAPMKPKGGGQVTLRMSRRAKNRLLNAQAKQRKRQFMSFKEALFKARDEGFLFNPEQFDTKDYSEKLNIALTDNQYQLIRDAAERYNVPFYSIISAIILEGVPAK